ncbi:MAG: efflux transporter outer membrane subunit [Thermomonas sp.]|jgi:NodT family efflux transporter outer membrane factor (OMF) lipoprotein|nr:efflux transporter outer membrane subunit [Thermomonas sp.]
MNATKLMLSSALAVLVAACSGPQLTPPKPLPAAPTSWSAASQSDQAAVVLDWWKGLNDPQLDRLVETALTHNADLRAATANWEASRALLREARAARLPIGTVDASLQRTRTAGAALQLDTLGGPSVLPSQTLIDAGTSFSWEIDLFGRVSGAVRETRAEAERSLWARRGAEAAIAAAVVRAWSDLADVNLQLALLDARQPLLTNIVAGLEQALAAGGVRRDKVEDARLVLADAEQQRPQLEAARRNAIRRLSTLTGVPAPEGVRSMAGLSPATLPAPAYVHAGRPENLLRLRPDVAAAEQDLLKATARIQVTRADLYPRLSLGGSVGVTAAPGNVTDTGALRFGVGPVLSWGIFDMARIRARIRAAGSHAEAASANWESAFLKALEETDAALDTLAALRRVATTADQAAATATTLADLSETRQRAGQDSRIAAALAREQALRTQSQQVRATSAMRSAWIDVQVALGAGWRDQGVRR